MRAIAQDVYGDTDVLSLREVDRPSPGPDEVLVRVHAAGVDPGVWILMTGRPYLMRIMGFGLRRPKVAVRGRDLAGVVESVGSAVTRFKPGDEVYGTCETGSFAEYAVAPEKRLAAKPAGLTFEQAAVVPVSGTTALQAVRAAPVEAGQRVLVTGAGGGVGSFAVQLAVAAGARVTAVCSGGKAELVRSLGASDVIDHTREPIDRDGPVYDVVLHVGGDRPIGELRTALAPRGTLVLVGGAHDTRPVFGGFERQLFQAPVLSLLGSQRIRTVAAKEGSAAVEELAALLSAGTIRPVVERSYPLAEAPEAIQHLGRRPAGKLVVTVSSDG